MKQLELFEEPKKDEPSQKNHLGGDKGIDKNISEEVHFEVIPRKNFGMQKNYLETFVPDLREFNQYTVTKYDAPWIKQLFYGIHNAKMPAKFLDLFNADEIIAIYSSVWQNKWQPYSDPDDKESKIDISGSLVEIINRMIFAEKKNVVPNTAIKPAPNIKEFYTQRQNLWDKLNEKDNLSKKELLFFKVNPYNPHTFYQRLKQISADPTIVAQVKAELKKPFVPIKYKSGGEWHNHHGFMLPPKMFPKRIYSRVMIEDYSLYIKKIYEHFKSIDR